MPSGIYHQFSLDKQASKNDYSVQKQLKSLRRHCTITGVRNVKQVSFKPGPEDCYGRCGRHTGMSAFDIARHMRSLMLWCLADRPLPPLHDSPCSPLVSTIALRGHCVEAYKCCHLVGDGRPTAMCIIMSKFLSHVIDHPVTSVQC